MRRSVSLLATVLLVLGVGVLRAAPAEALVLVNAPAYSIQVHRAIKVGVWYREWEGGPRAFRLKVVNPAGDVIFSRSGKAPEQWRIWSVKLHRVGKFRTIYRTKNFDGEWIRSVFPTRVRR